MVELIRLYREELPDYLEAKGVSVEVIDTTDISKEEVALKAEEIIKRYGGKI